MILTSTRHNNLIWTYNIYNDTIKSYFKKVWQAISNIIASMSIDVMEIWIFLLYYEVYIFLLSFIPFIDFILFFFFVKSQLCINDRELVDSTLGWLLYFQIIINDGCLTV